MKNRHLVLASQSPRRRQLLAEAGYTFEVIPPDDDAEGGAIPGEAPRDMVARLARQKAENVARRLDSGLIIGADTIAVCQGLILGKPADADEARRMLHTLRGCKHEVFSGLCLWKRPEDQVLADVARTTLFMDPVTDALIEDYIKSGGWQGKAGAFGFQDRLGWIHILDGSVSNVVGLPMEMLSRMLGEVITNY